VTDSNPATDPQGSGIGAGQPTRPGALGGEPEIVVRATPEDVSAEAANRIVDAISAAIDARGRAHFVTTGGSTPVGIYNIMASQLRHAVDWTRVEFWWGDDRYVPRDHPQSNVQAADSILFAAAQFAGQAGNLLEGVDVQDSSEPGLVVPVENIHPFPCTAAIAHARGAEWCAQQYAQELRDAGLQEARGFPVFDVILLGLGPDGHLMSVFPGSHTLDRNEWAMAVPAPTHLEPHLERVTLNPAVLGVARTVLMVTSGAAKAGIIGQIFGTERDPRVLPSQLVRRSGATWILDGAAAANLPDRLVRG
jgi:6-phosphogluconolactonase